MRSSSTATASAHQLLLRIAFHCINTACTIAIRLYLLPVVSSPNSFFFITLFLLGCHSDARACSVLHFSVQCLMAPYKPSVNKKYNNVHYTIMQLLNNMQA